MVFDYYGFAEPLWPALEDLAPRVVLSHLLGRRLEPRWLQKPASYFEDPDGQEDDADHAA